MTYHSITTLNEIRAAGPCEDGWRTLLAGLGKTKADDEPLPLAEVLRINGFDDATWVLRVPSLERLSRHFKAACAERVLHLLKNKRRDYMRVRDQIAMLRNDDATPEERAAAGAAAGAAVCSAAGAAAQVASRAAVCSAAGAAEWAAAMDAEWAAAWNAERAAQERILRDMIGVGASE